MPKFKVSIKFNNIEILSTEIDANDEDEAEDMVLDTFYNELNVKTEQLSKD